MTAVHSWVFDGTAQRHGPAGPATEQHAAYLVELSKAWAADPERPVWLQEVGAPAPHVPASRAAAFTAATARAALDCTHLWGLTWWCSHDVDRSLADFPELEYDLGLFTADRAPKPAAHALARAAAEYRAAPHRPLPRTTARWCWTRTPRGRGRAVRSARPAAASSRRGPCWPPRGCGPPSSWPATRRTPPAWRRAASPRPCTLLRCPFRAVP